jgi:succinate dehydrogenase / fumarate reductase, membrane anchor subunit
MQFLTARKRAEGQGASHSGAEHHWAMTVSSVCLAFLVPVWVYIFGSALGAPRDEVLETFANPFAAVVTALLLVIGMRHFAMGATVMLEDYSQGGTRRFLVIGATALAWVIAATGLFALARIAL